MSATFKDFYISLLYMLNTQLAPESEWDQGIYF